MRSKVWSPAVWPVMGSIVLAVSLSAANAPIELGVKGRGNATPTIAADGPFVAVTWGGTQPSGATDVLSMVVDAKKRIHIVWPTLITEKTAENAEHAEKTGSSQRSLRSSRSNNSEPTIALFYAMSADGQQFAARERIPTEGMPHHPRIVVSPDGRLTVAWDEAESGSRRIAVGRGLADNGGHPRFRREALRTGGPAIYPAVAVAGDGVVVAWTSGASAASVIQVARLAGSRPAGPDR